MEFNEIWPSILSTPNSYEELNGIKTLKVECIYKKENCAIFLGHKSDQTQTLFFARKGKRNDEKSWGWFCPSEIELRNGFPTLCEIYRNINQSNEKNRGNVKS